MNLSDIDVLILCGGKGTRLAPIIGDDIPKCLAPINGRPFIEYLIEYLAKQGLRKFVLVTGYLGGVVQEWKKQYKTAEGIEVSLRHTSFPAGPLQDAAKVESRAETVFILNGDTMPRGDLGKILGDLHLFRDAVELKLHGRSTGMYVITRELLNKSGVNVIQSEILTPFSFIDIGTPEGYAKAQEILQ